MSVPENNSVCSKQKSEPKPKSEPKSKSESKAKLDSKKDSKEELKRAYKLMEDSDDDGTGVNGDEESAAILAAVAVETAVEQGISHAEAVSRQARVSNTLEANRVERLVEQNEVKAAKVKDEKQISD